VATIELVGVAHTYAAGKQNAHSTYAVEDINLRWEHGVSSALLGPSGCGKTTLLKIISGLLKPTKGRVLLNGEEVNQKTPKERNIAQVFQFPVVYETLSVYDNLAFPLRNRKVDAPQVRSRVRQIAELLGLADKLNHNSATLGAADKQLISLGRGVVRDDLAAILLDEPLTVIDPHQKWHLRRKLKQLQQQLQLTMIYVTHDQHEALTFADQVTVMNVGVVLQTGSPQELHDSPQAPFVGYFIGSPGMNVFPAQLNGNVLSAGQYSIPIPESAATEMGGKNLKIGIRPEFVEILAFEHPDSIRSVVTGVHFTGNSKVLDLHGAELTFKVRVPDTSGIQAGDIVWAQFPAQWTMIYVDDRALGIGAVERAR
jgi:glycerol transport system ATP-binding protein